MTKAELKRQKQLRERLTCLVGKTLLPFQDRYLGAYVDWNILQIELELARLEEEHGTEKPFNNGHFTKMHKVDNSYRIKCIKEKLERKSLLTLEFITEAKAGYDRKFERLIDKLVEHKMSTKFLKVSTIGNSGKELSFLIENDDIEVHARAIWVEGSIKAPHYRFITTKRNKKK